MSMLGGTQIKQLEWRGIYLKLGFVAQQSIQRPKWKGDCDFG